MSWRGWRFLWLWTKVLEIHLGKVLKGLLGCWHGMNFHEYRVDSSIFPLRGKTPRAECFRYNEKFGCCFIKYKNNNNIIAQQLQRIRWACKTAGMMWLWQRCLRWSLVMWKRRHPISSQLGKTAVKCITCQKPRNHSVSIKCIAGILIGNFFFFSLENWSRHVMCKPCLHLNLLRSSYSWQISVCFLYFKLKTFSTVEQEKGILYHNNSHLQEQFHLMNQGKLSLLKRGEKESWTAYISKVFFSKSLSFWLLQVFLSALCSAGDGCMLFNTSFFSFILPSVPPGTTPLFPAQTDAICKRILQVLSCWGEEA